MKITVRGNGGLGQKLFWLGASIWPFLWSSISSDPWGILVWGSEAGQGFSQSSRHSLWRSVLLTGRAGQGVSQSSRHNLWRSSVLLIGKAGPPTRLGCGGSGGWARKWLFFLLLAISAPPKTWVSSLFLFMGSCSRYKLWHFNLQEDFKHVLFDQVLSLRNQLYTHGILMLEGER